jgi:uncharacterized delta-60 repeat protein
MKRPLDALASAASGRMASSAGIATGLVVPLALGAPGNLDTNFADHGRALLETEFGGQVWAVEALDNGEVFVAGGDLEANCDYYWGYYCDYYGSNFASELTAEGEFDPSFNLERIVGIEVRDAIRQPDGKVILVGRRKTEFAGPGALAVYRVEANGALDTAFGTLGIFELPTGDGTYHVANSIALDLDGRIVVAGSVGENLVVLALTSDGALDTSFGEGGKFVGPHLDNSAFVFIERTAAAGYRLTTTSHSRCQVLGLTAGGALDNSFGDAGIADIGGALDVASSCRSIISQSDGSLLVAGIAEKQGFAGRLLATGATDGTFSAASVGSTLDEATALAVDGDGRILVAGVQDQDAKITRLNSDGSVDASFGEGGTTLIDLPSDQGAAPRVNALDARADGRVLAGGGDSYSRQPFVIQLHSDGAVDSPGVLSFAGPYVEASEGGDFLVKVRRTGGKTGSVSVDDATVQDETVSAVAGEDYDEVAGTLTWGDGDASDREISVPIHDNGLEEFEELKIALDNLQGGAGLGQRKQRVTILADGAPAGQFQLEVGDANILEFQNPEVSVYRNFYTEGAVSVTVTPIGGTATAGEDFIANAVTLNWADGDYEAKLAVIGLLDDDVEEGIESLMVELSNPTGGAVIGPQASRQVSISANDRPVSNGGGGGSLGWLSVLFLALMTAIRPQRLSGQCSRSAEKG